MNRARMDSEAGNGKEPKIVFMHLKEGIGLALDLNGGQMFVTDLGGSVYGANLDGSNRRTLLVGQGRLTALRTRRTYMAHLTYEREITGLVVIDPYNDFISEGGKVWDRLKGVAEANQGVPHMKQVLEAARKSGIWVFYALHRRYRPGDYESWKYIAPIQKAAWSRKTFEYGSWGGEIRAGLEPLRGDIVAAEHWCSSGFANTDLELQLKKHGIQKLIVMGLIAHTCVEATVRYAAELGYEVTVVKDATASYSDEHMHAALEVNIPNYASAIVATDEIVDALSSLNRVEVAARPTTAQ